MQASSVVCNISLEQNLGCQEDRFVHKGVKAYLSFRKAEEDNVWGNWKNRIEGEGRWENW